MQITNLERQALINTLKEMPKDFMGGMKFEVVCIDSEYWVIGKVKVVDVIKASKEYTDAGE